MNQRPHEPGNGPVLLGAAAVLAVLLCCAGPVLVTAGTLAGIGGLLGNPWVIAATGALLAAALVAVARRRTQCDDRRADRCCPPPLDPTRPKTRQPDQDKE